MKPTFEELLEHAKMNANSGESLCPSEELELIAGFEAKCAALAEEVQALKIAAIFLSDEAAEIYKRWNLTQQPDGDIIDMQTIHDLVCACHDTPATDEFLAELRAQGVEMFAESLPSIGDTEVNTYEDGVKAAFETIQRINAPLFSAQLRQGAAQ